MAKTGRPRKATEQLKLEGTYRKDRHANNVDAMVSDLVNMPSSVEVPESLTDEYVIAYFQHHSAFLCKLRILTISDLPELENMFLVLQHMRQVRSNLEKINMVADFDTYEQMMNLWLKLSRHFSALGSKYFIAPVVRNRMTLDALHIEKSKKELEKPASALEKLISNKKS